MQNEQRVAPTIEEAPEDYCKTEAKEDGYLFLCPEYEFFGWYYCLHPHIPSCEPCGPYGSDEEAFEALMEHRAAEMRAIAARAEAKRQEAAQARPAAPIRRKPSLRMVASVVAAVIAGALSSLACLPLALATSDGPIANPHLLLALAALLFALAILILPL